MPPEKDIAGDANKPNEKTGVDLGKILLPKKETPGETLGSAQRAPAGELLKQEQDAQLPKPQKPPVAPVPKVDESVVKPLQTYQGDIERVVQQKNVSVVSIAAAEADRKSEEVAPEEVKKFNFASLLTTSMIAGGVILLTTAVGLLSYFFWPTAVPVPSVPNTPFISVDEITPIATEQSNLTRDSLMRKLVDARASTNLSLGLVGKLEVTLASSSDVHEMSPSELLYTLAPKIPEEFVRTLKRFYLLGIHSFENNQPFLIVSTDTYERAYAGMLEWERTMRAELYPLFEPPAPVPSVSISTSTPVTERPATVLQTEFIDRIIENHDTRILTNQNGEVVLLWTFLDQQTILIAMSEGTLKEIIRRLEETPTIPEP